MNRKILAIVAIVLLAGLAGCLGGEESSPEQQAETPDAEQGDVFGEVIESNEGGEVQRFVDEEAGVVCYIFDEEGAIGSGAGWQSGASCVPLDETNL